MYTTVASYPPVFHLDATSMQNSLHEGVSCRGGLGTAPSGEYQDRFIVRTVCRGRQHTSVKLFGVICPQGQPITMSLEAARDLSIQDLLRVLNEKLGLECTTLRHTPLPPAVSAASLEPEVSEL